MLAISGNAKVFLHNEPTDMRKGFEGLSGIVEEHFSEPLTSGAYFVFLNKKRDRMKALYWDVGGLAIWYKRLEKGIFPERENQQTLLDRREFFMLLEGIQPKKLYRRYKVG